MAKISMIVPVYNVAPYLEECFQSLANQTFGDAEFILIDDGSTDESGDICDRWAAKDSRFIAIHQKNGGVSSARNKGLETATGEYIGFVDSDDWLELDALEHLNSLLDENPEAAIASAGYYEYISGGDGKPLLRPNSADVVHGITTRETSIRNMMVRYGYFTAIWNKAFRRSAVYMNGIPLYFDTTLHWGEDEKWLMTLLYQNGRCVFSPVPIYHWRSRPSSVTHQSKPTPKLLTLLDAHKTTVEIVRAVSSNLEHIALGRMYNDTFILQVLAYCSNQEDALRKIRNAQKGTWLYWLTSRYVLPLRKAKVIVVRTMMALHLPAAWVHRVFDIKRNQKESVSDQIT